MIENADNIKIRCSSLGLIMTEPKEKAARERGELSETCKKHLIEIFVNEKYGREKDILTKHMMKGLMVEEDAITLYSRIRKKVYRKNQETISNDFIKGTPDLFEGESIRKAETILDVKSSWDIFTFFNSTTVSLNKNYYWQMQGYMALTGATSARLAYCLVNTPEILISDEKRRLMYKMNAISEENADYQTACLELEHTMIYDDIPFKERALEIIIERADFDINKIYDRVSACREYMNQYLFKETILK